MFVLPWGLKKHPWLTRIHSLTQNCKWHSSTSAPKPISIRSYRYGRIEMSAPKLWSPPHCMHNSIAENQNSFSIRSFCRRKSRFHHFGLSIKSDGSTRQKTLAKEKKDESSWRNPDEMNYAFGIRAAGSCTTRVRTWVCVLQSGYVTSGRRERGITSLPPQRHTISQSWRERERERERERADPSRLFWTWTLGNERKTDAEARLALSIPIFKGSLYSTIKEVPFFGAIMREGKDELAVSPHLTAGRKSKGEEE